ncbi:MAG: GNAT family N-acetyltransferase [Thermodesulfobacteriota bacterium]
MNSPKKDMETLIDAGSPPSLHASKAFLSESNASACRFSHESMESLSKIQGAAPALRWTSPFVFPFWMRLLPDVLKKKDLLLLSGHDSEKWIGIAPLMRVENTAHLFGNPDLCDYLDIITAPGYTRVFFDSLLEFLSNEGIRELNLSPVHPDSISYREILPAARILNVPLEIETVSETYELPLPGTWSGYLEILNGHQRHEVRRKLRRIAGFLSNRFNEIHGFSQIEKTMELFIEWFRRYHSGKRAFMDPLRESFFKNLSRELEERSMLRLFLFEIDQKPAAITFCMEYEGMLYLYNNAYSPEFESYSAGTLSKIFSIREGIIRGLKGFSFLKGDEAYKKRLGGEQVPLYRIAIKI